METNLLYGDLAVNLISGNANRSHKTPQSTSRGRSSALPGGNNRSSTCESAATNTSGQFRSSETESRSSRRDQRFERGNMEHPRKFPYGLASGRPFRKRLKREVSVSSENDPRASQPYFWGFAVVENGEADGMSAHDRFSRTLSSPGSRSPSPPWRAGCRTPRYFWFFIQLKSVCITIRQSSLQTTYQAERCSVC